MVQVSIRTEEKRYKKFNIHGFKVKPWGKDIRLTFTKGEEVLHTICEEMQERGLETGKIFLTIYFEEKEIECGPMTVAITEEYPLLVDLVKQEMIQSMDETTTEEETKILRRVLESIQQTERHINWLVRKYSDQTLREPTRTAIVDPFSPDVSPVNISDDELPF